MKKLFLIPACILFASMFQSATSDKQQPVKQYDSAVLLQADTMATPPEAAVVNDLKFVDSALGVINKKL